MIRLWSSMYLDNVCEKCENCFGDDERCPYFLDDERTELDYDYLSDIIKEDFDEKFGENNFEYFVIGDSYTNFYGLNQNFCGNYTQLFNCVSDIIEHLSQGGCYEGFRIYKGKYNRIYIERLHHDGVEWYQLVRLNKMGREHLDNGYDIDYRKYMITQTFKDFKFYW